MMTLKTMKGRVAVEPFTDTSVKTSITGAGSVKVARIENKVTLQGLGVVFDSEDSRFQKGQVAFVRSSNYTQPWAKEVLEYCGTKYILVPDNFVEAIASV